MTRATNPKIGPPEPARSGARRRGRLASRPVAGALAVLGVVALAACGGDDDPASSTSTTTPTTNTSRPSSTVATTTTTPTTTTTTVQYVTEGATVVVANASGIDGAAQRLTDRLAEVGYTTGAPANSTEGPLSVTKVYYDPANPNAKPVADSLVAALGGGDIAAAELSVPAPVSTGDIGEATVLVAMGNDVADKPLSVLQGGPTTTTTPGDTATDESESASESDT